MKDIRALKKKLDQRVESVLLAPLALGNEFASEMVKPIKPVIDRIDTTVEEFKKARDDFSRVLFSTDHQSLLEAMLADFVDTIPYVGDATEAMRLADAQKKGDRDAVVAHGTDLVVGNIFDIIPGVGEFVDSFLDALLPANTLLYLKRKGLIEWKPPNPPLPKLKVKREVGTR